MPRSHPPEFRRKVLDLVEAGRPIRQIAELETEPAVHRRAAELLDAVVPPKGAFETIAVMAGEGLPAQVATRVLRVAESGYHHRRSRPLSARAVRQGPCIDLVGPDLRLGDCPRFEGVGDHHPCHVRSEQHGDSLSVAGGLHTRCGGSAGRNDAYGIALSAQSDKSQGRSFTKAGAQPMDTSRG